MIEIKSWRQVSLDTKIYYTMYVEYGDDIYEGNICETKVKKIVLRPPDCMGVVGISIEFVDGFGIIEENFEVDSDIIRHGGMLYSYNRETIVQKAIEICNNGIDRLSKDISNYKETIENLKNT